jgi:hypothetical protein
MDISGLKVRFLGENFRLACVTDPLIAFSLKLFGRIVMVSEGCTLHTIQLRVVMGYVCLKLGNQLMKKKIT